MLTTWTLAIILLADRIVKSPWWPVSHACSLKSWSSQSARPHHAYSQLLGRQECFWSLAVLYERPQLASQHQRTLWVSLPELLSPESWLCFVELFLSDLLLKSRLCASCFLNYDPFYYASFSLLFFFLPFCAFSLCLFCRLICQSFLFELGPWRTMMETTKARSPNLIWHLRSLDDYIRMCTESSMLTSASYCHWWESEKSILALHVLDPSLIFHRLLQGN